jgi:hypothetical protein
MESKAHPTLETADLVVIMFAGSNPVEDDGFLKTIESATGLP